MATLRRWAAVSCVAAAAAAAAVLASCGGGVARGGDASASHATPWSFKPFGGATGASESEAEASGTIDGLIDRKLSGRGMARAGPAGRLTLLRRAYFDLTGLPPDPAEVEAFAKDGRPDAFERLVGKLLDSPAYGERWGKHWLDVVRYADTGGFEKDHLYPTAWRYRDYVIRSFNADKPFDRFVAEQIAGDELWPDDPDAVTATGMYCVGAAVDEAAMSPQLEYEWRTDAVDTTAAAFLGLTAGCARCHDHKYDPVSQKDYFALQAAFGDSDRPWPAALRLLRIKGLNGLLSDTPVPKEFLDDPRCTLYTEDKTGGFRLFHRARPEEIHVLHRGQLGSPREAVGPAVPAALRTPEGGQALADAPPERRRAALAGWIASAGNPLTARVIVNRVWAWHFGEGIVRTPNDFGNQGEPPSHPELLDYLARDLVAHGWSLKRLHRVIMLSGTYRMGSVADPGAARVDPENRLLSHFPRQRLDGESVRDALLACAGTLNPARFGPAVVPPLGAEELAGLFDAKGKWPVTKDAAQHDRRSVYMLVRRTFVLPMLAAFDAPDLMTSCARRYQTTAPTQALALLNGPVARGQARALARRLLADWPDDPAKRVEEAWVRCFGRPVTAAERAKAMAFLDERTGDREGALSDLCLALFNANEFVYVD